MSEAPYFSKRAEIEAACERMAAMPGMFQLPLWRAAADGVLALACIWGPEVRWPEIQLRRMSRSRRPILILIGADQGPDIPDVPPQEWRASWALRHWAQIAFMHGAAGHHDHYRAAVEATRLFDRIAFIECSSKQAAPWAAHLRCPRTNLFLPADGVHPVPARERMQ